MKNFFFLLAALAFCVVASAQQREVEFATEYGTNGDLVIRANIIVPGIYTVLLHFTESGNYNVGGYEVRPIYASGEVMRLKRANSNVGGSPRFTTLVTPGIVGRDRTDSSFVYTLPYSVHKKDVRYGFTRLVSDNISKERTQGWISLIFKMQRGDTIFAARKGTVVEVKDEYPNQLIYPSRVNSIQVQHADNTFARYYCIEHGGMLVGKGDVVYPGAPLAIVGTGNGGESYNFYFNISNLRVDNSGDYPKFQRVFYNPIFATAEGNTKLDMNKSYAAVLPEAVVTKEMNGKEKKNYLASGYRATTVSKSVAEVVATAAAAPVGPAQPSKTTIVTSSGQPATTVTTAMSTPKNIKLSSFRGPDGTYAVDAEVVNPLGVYSVGIAFRDVDNYPLPPYLFDTVSVSRRLLSVKLTDPGRHGSANFSSSTRLGMATVPADTAYAYRLPFRPEDRDVTYGIFPTSPTAKQVRFMMDKGDMIHAVREGLVVSVNESASTSSPSCTVVVQHPDGSDATYSAGIQRDALLVGPGDRVAEGDPLGTVGNKSGWLSLTLKYTVIDEAKQVFVSGYFNPVFRTEKGYVRLLPPDQPVP